MTNNKCKTCKGTKFIYSSNFTADDITPNEIECPDCDKTNKHNNWEELIEDLLTVVSDCDLLDTYDVENFYRNQDRIINGSRIDNAWEALGLKGGINQTLQSEKEEWKKQVIEILEKYKGDACYSSNDIINLIKQLN